MDKIIVYCDGACSGNQFAVNVGGWGAVIQFPDGKAETICGGTKNTTNNIMELSACIKALEAIRSTSIPVEIYVDSQYVCSGMNEWHKNWERNGWRNSKGKPVENRDLWVRLLQLAREQKKIKFIKVKGHAGIELNELADQLANKGMDEIRAMGDK